MVIVNASLSGKPRPFLFLARKSSLALTLSRTDALDIRAMAWSFCSLASRCPLLASRQRIGATQQSTIVNSSLMKNGFSPNIGAIESRLSRNSLRAFSNCAGVPCSSHYRIDLAAPVLLDAVDPEPTLGSRNWVDRKQRWMRKSLIKIFHHDVRFIQH